MPIQARKKTIIPRQRVKKSLHWKISPRGWTAFPVAANFAKKKGHPMSCCSTYASAQTRQARCRELNLCTLCTSTRHKMKDCLGKWNKLTALTPLTNPSSYQWYPFQCLRADRNTTLTVCLILAARGHTFPRGWRKN